EVYDGPDANSPTEVDIQDDMPEAADDWDEAEVRAQAAEEVERLTEEAQPGKVEEIEASADIPRPSGAEAPLQDSESSAALKPSTPASQNRACWGPRRCATQKPGSSVEATAGPHVVLKIRRRKFQQQFRSGELVVTRRLFRSGDSEYLLNGKLCRLRDIQELFMGTGLGPESYALIEQGRIGQILSSRPTDRRAIIEEAAGITKFKTRK